MSDLLRDKVIRLAHHKPALRPDLLPLVKQAGRSPSDGKIMAGMRKAYSEGYEWQFGGEMQARRSDAESEMKWNLDAMKKATTEREFLASLSEFATYLAHFCAAKGEELNSD